MPLEFLEWLGFVEKKLNLFPGQMFDTQKVAQAFRHFFSSDKLPESNQSSTVLLDSFDEHYPVLSIDFLEADLDNLLGARLHSPADKTRFDRKLAMPAVDQHHHANPIGAA
jgi:hypothetical protein